MKKAVNKINQYLESFENNRVVVGLDGYSGLGKTTIANEIEQKNKNVKVLHLDDYVVTANTKEKLGSQIANDSEKLELQWANTNNKNFEKLKEEIQSFKESENDKNILLVEGIFFSHQIFNGYFDKIIFLDGDESIADERRVAREKERWGDKYFPENHPDSFTGLFKIAWKKYLEIYKPKENADLIVEI